MRRVCRKTGTNYGLLASKPDRFTGNQFGKLLGEQHIMNGFGDKTMKTLAAYQGQRFGRVSGRHRDNRDSAELRQRADGVKHIITAYALRQREIENNQINIVERIQPPDGVLSP